MFHIDGTECSGDDSCEHWSHGDKPMTLSEIATKMRETGEKEGWV